MVSLFAFAFVERTAKEPVLPLRLFSRRTFTLASTVALSVGFALFGSVTYFPLYLQVVHGVSPTASGLQMVPMMLGMLTTSVISGQMISRTGRYKRFPIAGTAVMTLGLILLSRLSTTTTPFWSSAYLTLLGLGLGMVMQVLVIAVQNDVDYHDLGVATSGATLFRFVGGSLGTAVLGAIFASQVQRRMIVATAGGETGGSVTMEALSRMSPAAHAAYASIVTSALNVVFEVAAVVGAVSFVLAWIMPERPLRTTVAESARSAGNEAGEAFGRPSDEDAVAAQIYAALSSLADRDVQRQHIAAIVERAGEDLSTIAAFLLVRLDREPAVDPSAHGRRYGLPPERIAEGMKELRERGLIEPGPSRALTDRGCEVLTRIVDARRAHLAELASDFDPDAADVAEYLRETARHLVPAIQRRG